MTGSDDTVLDDVSNDTLLDDVSPLQTCRTVLFRVNAGEPINHIRRTCNETRNLYRSGGSF